MRYRVRGRFSVSQAFRLALVCLNVSFSLVVEVENALRIDAPIRWSDLSKGRLTWLPKLENDKGAVGMRTTLKRTSGLIAAGIAIALLAGCGASEVVQTETVTSGDEGKTTYPFTLQNCGREITIDKAPQRVVSLDQNSTEILLSLGLEDRMVGTASWTDPVLDSLAAANEKVPRLANEAPTYEVLMDTNPDFVTASFGRHFKENGGVATRDRLQETGIGSYLSPTDCEGDRSINAGGKRTTPLTVDVLYQEIRELSQIFDVQDKGAAFIAQLQDRAKKSTDGLNLGGKKVMFWFADTRTPYVAGGLGSAALLADQTDLKNVFSDSNDDWPASTWETVVDRQPDIMVLGDLQREKFPGDRLKDKEEFLANDPLTKTLPAVQKGCYIALHGAEMNPAIRFVDGLEKIRSWADDPKNSCL